MKLLPNALTSTMGLTGMIWGAILLRDIDWGYFWGEHLLTLSFYFTRNEWGEIDAQAGFILVGLATVLMWADGRAAKYFDARSKIGEEILQPLCGLAAGLFAVIGVTAMGMVPPIIPLLFAVVLVGLQLIHQLRDVNPTLRQLKQLQVRVHPIMASALLISTVFFYAWGWQPSYFLQMQLAALLAFGIYSAWDYLSLLARTGDQSNDLRLN